MARPLARAKQLAVAQVQRVQLGMMPELHVGAGSLFEVPDVLAGFDVDCAMIVTTPGFVERGTLAPFLNALLTKGITTAVFSDVKPDPDIDCVERAAETYRSHGCDAMVAIGGGSVMDCAKVAGALVARPGKHVRDLIGTMKVRKATPLLVAVPTTAGTGSEVTAAAVVTDPMRQRKYAVSDVSLIPDVAVLDPALLVGLPQAMTAYSGMDALTHAVEAYINRYGSAASRQYAEMAVDAVFKHLKASYDNPKDVEHREGMLMASYWAGVAFTNAMVGYVHALAHSVGGRYHVQHGLANAVLLPIVLEEYGKAAEGRLARLAEIIGLGGSSDGELAKGFIGKIRELSAQVGIPECIPEIREEDIPVLAIAAEREGNPAYPVPAVWTCGKFEEALRRASGGQVANGEVKGFGNGGAAEASAQTSCSAANQTRITQPGPLLDETGRLAVRGWATSLIRTYDRSSVRTSRLRIKEWDYYLVNDGEFALALTIGDMGYAALVSASVVDFVRCTYTTQSTMGLLPLGRLSLPTTSSLGVTSFADKRVKMRFEVAGGMRRLAVEFQEFSDGKPLVAEVVLDEEPRDTMVIATPWVEDELAFYYNQKIVGMRAIGSFTIGDEGHIFEEGSSFGLLDWGRGVWTRDNTWFWSAAQGVQGSHLVGFNLGYGFGDTSSASENMLFVDGVAHKLGRVDFGIPVAREGAREVGKRFALMSPWHMADDEGRLDLTFTPDVDRSDFVNLKLVVSDQHQVFGVFDGRVVLDDGTVLGIEGLRGFAEAVHNVY